MPTPTKKPGTKIPAPLPPSSPTSQKSPTTPPFDDILKAAAFGQTSDAPITSLVLSGGGAKGSFEIGALLYLAGEEKIWRSINIRSVCGTSVGAINGLVVAESGREGIMKLSRLYLGLQSKHNMYLDADWFFQVKAIGLELGIRIESYDDIRMEIGAIDLPDRSDFTDDIITAVLGFWAPYLNTLPLRQDLEKLENIYSKVERVFELLKSAQEVYNLSPIEDMLRRDVNFEAVGFVPLRMAVVCLEDGQIYYVTEKGELLQGGANASNMVSKLTLSRGLRDVLIQGALASAAIPGIFPMKKLDPDVSKHYVDGGVREMLPMQAAVELGAKRIVAIVASPLKPQPALDFSKRHLLSIVERSVDLSIEEVKIGDVQLQAGIEHILIHPDLVVHNTTEVNPGLIRINMAYGFMRAHEKVFGTSLKQSINNDIFRQLEVLTFQIIKLRKRIWEIEHSIAEIKLLIPNWPGPRNPKGGRGNRFGSIALSREGVQEIRKLKKQLLALVEDRLTLVDYDPCAMPINLGIDSATGTSIKLSDWWSKWERHGFDHVFRWVGTPLYDNLFDNIWPDPWVQLKKAFKPDTRGKELLDEDPLEVPARPLPSSRLQKLLDSQP